MEIVLCMVGLYVIIAFYTLGENLTGKHVKTRDASDVARIAWESVVWPVVMLPWRELPSWLRQEWARLPVRYSEVAA